MQAQTMLDNEVLNLNQLKKNKEKLISKLYLKHINKLYPKKEDKLRRETDNGRNVPTNTVTPENG